jgi:hypothetical protein
MVMEGRKKMDSLLTPISNIESTLVTALQNGEINVGVNGVAFLRKCIWKKMKSKVTVNGHNALHLDDASHDDFLATIKRIPHSDQLVMDIGKWCFLCVKKFTVTRFIFTLI